MLQQRGVASQSGAVSKNNGKMTYGYCLSHAYQEAPSFVAMPSSPPQNCQTCTQNHA